MVRDDLAIEICAECNLIKTSIYTRGNGRHCATISVVNPISRVKFEKTVSSKHIEKVHAKVELVKKELYALIRDDFLKSHLMVGPLTLKRYIELDLPYLKATWPTAYGAKEYTALIQYGSSLTCDLNACTNMDDFLPQLSALGLNRQTELIILRMLRDIIDKMIQLGLYVHTNPTTQYYQTARNQTRKIDQSIHSQALATHTLASMYNEYCGGILSDARYFAIFFKMLNLSSAQIAALNLGDLRNLEGSLSLLIHNQMFMVEKRYVSYPISNEWAVRLLPINWLRNDIEQWIAYYTGIGIKNTDNIPLCAFGCRKNPKRCTPEEIDQFLKKFLDRHAPVATSTLIPISTGNEQSFREVTHKVSPKALHTSLLVVGHAELEENPFISRYILGQPAETVDEINYLDFTSPRMQDRMNNLIIKVFTKMGLEMEAI